MVRAIRLALEGVDVKLEQAACVVCVLAGIFDHYVAVCVSAGDYCVHGAVCARSLGEFGATMCSFPIFPVKRAPSLRRCVCVCDCVCGVGRRPVCASSPSVWRWLSCVISEWLARVSRQRMGG